jgi:hypothetical protein
MPQGVALDEEVLAIFFETLQGWWISAPDVGIGRRIVTCHGLTFWKTEGVIGSKQGHTGDALASAGDEGRDKLR